MYHFLQFNPNKKEAWRLYDEKQLSELPQPPAFITVLRVDQDPENYAENGEDPLDHVKYLGPMYFDFDGADLDEVLDSVRAVLDALTRKLDISKDYIHCWLSGQKGVHITVPEQVFGIKGPMKALPLIYREVAATFKAPCLDMSVYSAGRGRMWRCENIARPGTGTFKVGTTVDELMDMDAEQYEVLVASARPPLARATPPKNVIHARAESILKTAKAAALQKIKAMKSSTVVPKDALREYGETPEPPPGVRREPRPVLALQAARLLVQRSHQRVHGPGAGSSAPGSAQLLRATDPQRVGHSVAEVEG